MDKLAEYIFTHLRVNKPKLTENTVSRITGHIKGCVKFFEGKGITIPSASEYDELRDYLSQKSGRKGSNLSESNIADRLSETRKYYDWLSSRQSPNRQMQIDGMVDSEEPKGGLSMSEEIIDVEENATLEHSNITDNEPVRRKRGRKAKPENLDRVQVSIYLSKEIYEGIKDYAAFRNENISDVSASLISEFVLQHLESINKARNFLKELNFR